MIKISDRIKELESDSNYISNCFLHDVMKSGDYQKMLVHFTDKVDEFRIKTGVSPAELTTMNFNVLQNFFGSYDGWKIEQIFVQHTATTVDAVIRIAWFDPDLTTTDETLADLSDLDDLEE